MPTPRLPDDLAIEAALAYRANGESKRAAAKSLGLNRKTFTHRLSIAAERGLLSAQETLPGFAIRQITETPNGTYVQQRKEHGAEWEPTDGLVIKGKTSLVDAEGRVITQHIMERSDHKGADPLAIVDALKRAMDGYATAEPIPAPEIPVDNLLTLTPLADWHIGLRAWSGDTGMNWDLSIAERVIGQGIDEVVARSPASAHAIVLGGGDLLHSDSNENKTARSGNVLDVDGRYDKCVEVAGRLLVRTVDAHLRRHGHVTVRILKGNHDEHSSVAIAYFLKGWYRNEPRVTIDTDASLFFWFRFGKVMLGATHGHAAKITDMPSIMAHRRAEDWGATVFRYIHGFHLHHSSKYATEGKGCISEVHQTPTPQDAWHFGSGFLSGRSIQSISYDRNLGEVGRVRVAMLDGLVPEAANDNFPFSRAA